MIQLRSQMQYKSSFFMLCIGQFLASFSYFLGMYFLFDRFHAVEGFTFESVLLCFCTTLLSFAIAECFGRGFDLFPRMLGNGEFDRVLLRPRSPILQVLGQRMELSRIGRVIQAIVVLIYTIPRCGVVWTADKILTFMLMIVGGSVFFIALFIVYASLCFFTTEGLEFMNILTDGGREFGSYPMVIYGESILKFFTYVIPMAMFQYYPFLYLVGHTSDVRYALAPLVCILFVLPCYALWRIGLRHFKSTGS